MFENKTILVTGSKGFLGKHLVSRLKDKANVIESSRNLWYQEQCHAEVGINKPDIVFNLAAKVGGIQANANNQADFFTENLRISMNMVEACKPTSWTKPIKLINLGSTCMYPGDCRQPMYESNIWDGYPEPTNAGYALAKRAILEIGQAHVKQYGMNIIFVILANLYGPGDHFESDESHVIPAMIKKFLGNKDVELWGSGSATREFLFVEDAVDALILLAEKYNDASPINVGSGEQITIFNLAQKVARLTGFDKTKHKITWDTLKPNGQASRLLDSQAVNRMGFKAKTTLEEGLKKTMEWYKWQQTDHRAGQTLHALAGRVA